MYVCMYVCMHSSSSKYIIFFLLSTDEFIYANKTYVCSTYVFLYVRMYSMYVCMYVCTVCMAFLSGTIDPKRAFLEYSIY